MSEVTLRPKACVICEDIRREASGQFTLVGVYPNDVQCTEAPAVINLSCYLIVEISGVGETMFFVENRITYRASSEIAAEMKGQLKVGSLPGADGCPTVLGFDLPVFTASIQEDAEYEVRWSNDDKIWKTIHTMNIDVPTVVEKPAKKTKKLRTRST